MRIYFTVHVGIVLVLAGGVVQGVGAMDSEGRPRKTQPLPEVNAVVQKEGSVDTSGLRKNFVEVVQEIDASNHEDLAEIKKSDADLWNMICGTIIPSNDQTFEELIQNQAGATLAIRRGRVLKVLKAHNPKDKRINQLEKGLKDEESDDVLIKEKTPLGDNVKPLDKKKPKKNPSNVKKKKDEFLHLDADNIGILLSKHADKPIEKIKNELDDENGKLTKVELGERSGADDWNFCLTMKEVPKAQELEEEDASIADTLPKELTQPEPDKPEADQQPQPPDMCTELVSHEEPADDSATVAFVDEVVREEEGAILRVDDDAQRSDTIPKESAQPTSDKPEVSPRFQVLKNTLQSGLERPNVQGNPTSKSPQMKFALRDLLQFPTRRPLISGIVGFLTFGTAYVRWAAPNVRARGQATKRRKKNTFLLLAGLDGNAWWALLPRMGMRKNGSTKGKKG